jgi:arabinofuranosyltransferase
MNNMSAGIDMRQETAKGTPFSGEVMGSRLRFPGAAVLDRVVARHPLPVVLALLAFAVLVLWPYRHFSGDDAYITFRFARNFATGHGFAFNPDVPVYGSTAPLWVFLIAATHSLGFDFPAAAHALNWVFLGLNVLIFFKIASDYIGRSSAAIVAAVLMLLDPWFIRWSLSGMENGLALCLLMSLILSQQRLRNSGRTNFLSPIAAALAGLCRPEMCLLSILLVMDIGLFERRRKVQNIVVTGVVYLLVFIPWLWYAHTHFDSIIPTTIRAKLSSLHLSAFLHTLQYFASFWPLQACAVVIVAVMMLRGRMALRIDEATAQAWFLPVAWATILPAFYVVGGAPVAGRYMMFGLPCYLLIGVKAWTLLSEKYPRLVVASILATVALVGLVQYKYCWYVTRWPQGMDPKMIMMANTLKKESRDSAMVAGDQIGVLGYFSDRYVLDTYGLASSEILPYRKAADAGPIWRYVRQRRAEFLFVSDTRETLEQWDPSYQSLTLLDKEDVQREGSGAVGGLITYYLYRTNW